MPAPVPPGYTRGPILFLGASADPTTDQALRQLLWREAGGFGARLVLITVEPAHVTTLTMLRKQLVSWECERVEKIVVLERAAARTPEWVAPVEQATATVVIGDDPARLAAILGGTPLAQAIRRANARSKTVAGIGAAGAFLCQHMITPGRQPANLREQVTFGPGLGLVNRLVVDVGAGPTAHNASMLRLLAAVAANPFLIGVGLAPGSGAILYPDNTLHANGSGVVTILDGQEIGAIDLDEQHPRANVLDTEDANSMDGVAHYALRAGDGFNLDDHSLRPVGEIDLPPTGPVTSAF